MGKFVNKNGKIRILAFKRCSIYYFICRKGKGIFVAFTIETLLADVKRGKYTTFSNNYELVNRTIKNNSILKLRDHQPDGLLILQTPKQLTLGI